LRLASGRGQSPGFPAGFSLVETLVAMAIVFFLLAGLAQVLCYSFLLKQKADLHRLSADIISRKVEVLKSLHPEDEALSPGVHQETAQDRNTGRSFFLTWEVIEEGEGLRKIQLSLFPAPFGSRPPVRVSWYRSETLGF
jgi:prepilin-type N-terminal cleavage/methylation domain-containing protein